MDAIERAAPSVNASAAETVFWFRVILLLIMIFLNGEIHMPRRAITRQCNAVVELHCMFVGYIVVARCKILTLVASGFRAMFVGYIVVARCKILTLVASGFRAILM